MPTNVIKGSLKYCLENKLFFLFVLLLFSILEILTAIANFYIIEGIFIILVIGYGLQITHDIINGGIRLPKIMPKKAIIWGIKGTAIILFYFFIQGLLLLFISIFLNFPQFNLEDSILEVNNTIMLIYQHDIVSFTIFIISGFIISYVTIFFMELSIARLSDGGQLRKSFNFRRIKHAIDVIGWKRYTIGYSKIIFVIVILSFIERCFDPYTYLDIVVDILCEFISFVIEFRGMGIIYKIYIDNKRKIAEQNSEA